MFCSHCGKENVTDAAFCSYCGKSISNTASPTSDDSSWEYCQIQASWKKHDTMSSNGYECYFWAEAIGQNGRYCAAQTENYKLIQTWIWQPFPNPPMGGKEEDQEKVSRLLSNLIKTLQTDGWEVLSDRGTNVWQYKFKRKVPTK